MMLSNSRRHVTIVNLLLLMGGIAIGAVAMWYLHGKHSGPISPDVKSSETPPKNLSIPNAGKSPLIEEMLLPREIAPVHYDLTLMVYLPGYGTSFPKKKDFTFKATINIVLHSTKPIDTITVNSKNLKFNQTGTRVLTEGGEEIAVEGITERGRLEKTEFILEREVEGRFNLTVEYKGEINEGLTGLYRTQYTTKDGEKRIAAVTKMEPTHARRMVPSFDEPSFKASWNVTIVHPRNTTALSNGIELGNPEKTEDFLVTRFKTTPVMSTYLLALMVSDFSYIEANTTSGVRFRVWARPEATETAQYALDAGIKCLEGYEKFFDIPFPMEKQDMVALPDFASGAMENWGLITYRETSLLYDKENYFYPNKQRVAQVIAHELAHQWFGNLVTMKWWDDIWLNEGFAAFVQSIGIDIIADGAYEMENDFVADQHRQTMELDSTAASHPIIFPTTHQEEISELFDIISYRKGASLISMIRRLMGNEHFNKGVQNYLKKYSYQNADHNNLFHEWDQMVPSSVVGPNEARLNVTDFALKWTRQMGYPYLTLEKVNSTAARVTQQRYKVDPNAKEREKFAVAPYGYKWDVPVWIQRGDSPEVELQWLSEGELVVAAREDEAVMLNADSYAIERVQYSENSWRNIFRLLETNSQAYSVRSKFRILSDAFAMADIGKIPYSLAFESIRFLKNETSHIPWSAFLSVKEDFEEKLGQLPEKKNLELFVRRLFAKSFKEIDIKAVISAITDEKSYMKRRVEIMTFLEYCKANGDGCKEQLKRFYEEDFAKKCKGEEMASKCSKVPPSLRGVVYKMAVRTGGETVFGKMLEMYKRESLQLERERILNAMCSSSDPKRLKWLLSNLVNQNSTFFRVQDCGTVSSFISNNPVSSDFLLNYLIENWTKIYTKFQDTQQSILNKIIRAFTSQIRTKEDLQKLRAFLSTAENTGRYFVFVQQIQTAEKRIEWLEKYKEEVAEQLTSFQMK